MKNYLVTFSVNVEAASEQEARWEATTIIADGDMVLVGVEIQEERRQCMFVKADT